MFNKGNKIKFSIPDSRSSAPNASVWLFGVVTSDQYMARDNRNILVGWHEVVSVRVRASDGNEYLRKTAERAERLVRPDADDKIPALLKQFPTVSTLLAAAEAEYADYAARGFGANDAAAALVKMAQEATKENEDAAAKPNIKFTPVVAS